jgi:Transposase zinc-ribbon domain
MEALFWTWAGEPMNHYPKKSIAEMSDAEWEHAFPDEETCIEWLVNSRWPDELRCPRCGSDLVFPTSLHKFRWRCFCCSPDLGHSFDYLSGTIFHDSRRPLHAWLKAVHCELTGRGPSYDPSSQKMRRCIREAMREPGFRGMVGELGSVPRCILEPEDTETLSDAVQESCPDPAPSTILLR